jgi:16S rRNA (cytosine967-C5)-methyltransferase
MNRRALIAIGGELLHEFRVRRDAPADRVAGEFFRARVFLGSRDRAFISNAFYHALRHLRRFDEAILSAYSGSRIVAPSLLAGFPVSDSTYARVWQGGPLHSDSTTRRDRVADRKGLKIRRATRSEHWIDTARIFLAAVDLGLEKAEELSPELYRIWPRPKKEAMQPIAPPAEAPAEPEEEMSLLDAFVQMTEELRRPAQGPPEPEPAADAEPAPEPPAGPRKELHRSRFDEDIPSPPPAVIDRMAAAAVDHAASYRKDRIRPVPERTYSFPNWLWGLLGHGLRPAELRDFAGALNREAPTTLRVNTLRTTLEQARARLNERSVLFEEAAHAPHAIHLLRRVGRDSLPELDDGWFEFQDEASQLCAIYCAPQKGSYVVDACAGAGGKALHMAALMENDGTILCLDGDPARLRPLYYRRDRAHATCLQVSDAIATSEDVDALEADMILLDSPCSGTGTIRRRPDIKWRLSVERVQELVKLQGELLDFWAPGVRVGGTLVYATCSLLREENETQVEAFLQRWPNFVRDPQPGREALGPKASTLLTAKGDLALYPHRHGCDGFYAARLRRKA